MNEDKKLAIIIYINSDFLAKQKINFKSYKFELMKKKCLIQCKLKYNYIALNHLIQL